MNKLLATALMMSIGLTVDLGSASAETADLKVRFQYGAAAPEAKKVNVNKDVGFCGQHNLMEESVVVDPETKGIKNIVMYIYTGRGGTDLDEMPAGTATHELANKNCRFEPHVVVAQVGDTLKITNPDPVAHNANLNFFNNRAQNITIPPASFEEVGLEKDEPAPIPVDCNIHPWMKSYVVVLEHPFADVSDDEGTITIEGLPAGEELTFRIFHESLKIDEVKDMSSGETKKLRRARIEMELEPGMNDLGTWIVPAA